MRKEPTLVALVLRALALVIASFVAANVILLLHAPVGH